MSELSDATLVEMYDLMLRGRVFEKELGRVFHEMRRKAAQAVGDRRLAFDAEISVVEVPLQGNLELAIGQEPVAAGLCPHLRREDYLASTHRSHPLALGKGVDMRRMVAELYGKRTGLAQGRAGDLTTHAPEVNYETSGIMAQLIPVAVGHALAFKRQQNDNIAVCDFGEGAANQGVFHEALNLASLWKVPIVFLVCDNGYALSVSREKSTAIANISDRAAGYDIPSALVPDNDPVAIYEVVGAAVDAARSGSGPSFVEVKTDRIAGGFEGDQQHYRPPGELDEVQARDQLLAFESMLVERDILSKEDVEGRYQTFRDEVLDAIEYAESGPLPVFEDEGMKHVFA